MDYSIDDVLSLSSTSTLFLEIFDMETTDDNGNIIMYITEKTAFPFPNKNLDDLKPDDIIKIFKSEKKEDKQFIFKEPYGTSGMQKLYCSKAGNKEEAVANGLLKKYVQCVQCGIILSSSGGHLK